MRARTYVPARPPLSIARLAGNLRRVHVGLRRVDGGEEKAKSDHRQAGARGDAHVGAQRVDEATVLAAVGRLRAGGTTTGSSSLPQSQSAGALRMFPRAFEGLHLFGRDLSVYRVAVLHRLPGALPSCLPQEPTVLVLHFMRQVACFGSRWSLFCQAVCLWVIMAAATIWTALYIVGDATL